MKLQDWIDRFVSRLPEILPWTHPEDPEKYAAVLSRENSPPRQVVNACALIADEQSFEQYIAYEKAVAEIESEKSNLRTVAARWKAESENQEKANQRLAATVEALCCKYNVDEKELEEIVKIVCAAIKEKEEKDAKDRGEDLPIRPANEGQL